MPWFFFSLQGLEDFIKRAEVGLAVEVKEGDYDSLVKVMGFLGEVRERMAETDEMFEPLKQKIELLKTYNQEMPENVFLQLQVSLKGQTLLQHFVSDNNKCPVGSCLKKDQVTVNELTIIGISWCVEMYLE